MTIEESTDKRPAIKLSSGKLPAQSSLSSQPEEASVNTSNTSNTSNKNTADKHNGNEQSLQNGQTSDPEKTVPLLPYRQTDRENGE